MNTSTIDPLNHPFAVSNSLNNKNRLFIFLNQHGYKEHYGHPVYYQNYNKELPHVLEFLDALQAEEELRNWMRNVEVEQTTQRRRINELVKECRS